MNEPINIILDGPPGPKSGRFVEVETDDGKSINAGEWKERPGGYWALRITPKMSLTEQARQIMELIDNGGVCESDIIHLLSKQNVGSE